MRFWPRLPHPASYVAVLQTTSRRILAGWLAASSVLVSPLAPPTPVTRLRLCSLNKALPLIKSHSRSVRVCVCVRAGLALPTGLELAIGLCSHNVLGTYNTRTHKRRARLQFRHRLQHACQCTLCLCVLCVCVCERKCVCASVCLLSWRKHIWKICVGDIVVNHRHI